jgi:hypothetical protein
LPIKRWTRPANSKRSDRDCANCAANASISCTAID